MKSRPYGYVLALTALLLVLAACSRPASTATPAAAQPDAPPTSAMTGPELAAEFGCAACHSDNGNVSAGPTWRGLYGKEETLTDGSTITVDDAYLRESIVSPNAKVVQGFHPGVMPQDFGQRLTSEQITAIAGYIKSLR